MNKFDTGRIVMKLTNSFAKVFKHKDVPLDPRVMAEFAVSEYQKAERSLFPSGNKELQRRKDGN
jgi:hypothetical protein